LASGDVSQGEAELAEAISTVESLRLDVAGGEFERQGYFADKLEPYHRLVSLLADSGRTSDSLAYAERAKARVIVDVFSTGRARVESVMSDEERAQDQGFRIKLASLNARLAKERQRPPLTTGLTAEIDRARLDYAAFQAGLFARHPQLRAQRGAIDPVSLGDLGRLLPRDGAMLEFVVTEDALYSFVVTRGADGSSTPAVQVTRTPVSRSDLRGRVEDFRQRIANRDLAFRRSASDLYGVLIAPVRGLLGRARSLIIVPDATLWELPFQALLSPSGRYLLDDVAVSYAPSLTALRLMQRQKERLEAEHQTPRLLAMGNPAWDPRAKNRAAATSRDAELGSLELTEAEVSRLARIYGQARSRVYVRDQATERRFKGQAGDQQILHIATHGILNDASPLYSYVLLAPSSAPGLEDGRLEAWELLQMTLRARLVVLSACETARGRVTAGEGTIGLSWALFVAGVPTTVLSQWKADSASTTELMVAFHANVKRGVNEAAALRAAALDLRKNPAYAHPVYWAPFIVIGAGQAVAADSKR
jgi:CHAT domain-containing protein